MSDSLENVPEKAPLSPRTRWFAVGALAVAGAAFAVLSFGGLGKNLIYYWGPTQLRDNADKAIGATIRLGGMVSPGSIKWGADGTSVDFAVTDGVKQVMVHSSGIPPQMFRENIGVVVEGTMQKSGIFASSRLMVRHDNQYRAPKAGEKVDIEKMIKEAESEDGK